MTLGLYLVRHLLTVFCGTFGFLFLLFWLPNTLDLLPLTENAQGMPLPLWEKLAIAFGQSLVEGLELTSIALMIASLMSLTMLGRRAELQVMRGAGLRPLKLLAVYAAGAAVLTFAVQLVLAPVALELSHWGEAQLDASEGDAASTETFAETFATPNQRVAWASLNAGAFQIRLAGYDKAKGTAISGYLLEVNPPAPTDARASDVTAGDETADDAATGDETTGDAATGDAAAPTPAFRTVRQVTVSGRTLRAVSPETAPQTLTFTLDGPPRILATNRPSEVRSLPHILGWVGAGTFIGAATAGDLNERQFAFTLNQELAAPFASAALVLLAGGLAVGVGTRQPLGGLVINALTLVVLAYCLVVVSEAFGANGKLSPLVAAWGPPTVLASLGMAMLYWQEVSWILGFKKS